MSGRQSSFILDETHQKFHNEIEALREQIEQGTIIYDNRVCPGDGYLDDRNEQFRELMAENARLKLELEKAFKIIDENVKNQSKKDQYKIMLLHQQILRLEEQFAEFHARRYSTNYYSQYVSDRFCRLGCLDIFLIFMLFMLFGSIVFGRLFFQYHPPKWPDWWIKCNNLYLLYIYRIVHNRAANI